MKDRIEKLKVAGQWISLGPDVSSFITIKDVSNKLEQDDIKDFIKRQEAEDEFATKDDIKDFISKNDIPDDLVTKDDIEDLVKKDEISDFITGSDVSNMYVKKSTLDNLVNANSDGVINKFKEMENFLKGISDSSTLTQLLYGVKEEIENKIENLDYTVTIDHEGKPVIVDLNDVLDEVYFNRYTNEQIDASIIAYAQPKGDYITREDLGGLDGLVTEDDIKDFITLNDVSNKLEQKDLVDYLKKTEAEETYATKEEIQDFAKIQIITEDDPSNDPDTLYFILS